MLLSVKPIGFRETALECWLSGVSVDTSLLLPCSFFFIRHITMSLMGFEYHSHYTENDFLTLRVF